MTTLIRASQSLWYSLHESKWGHPKESYFHHSLWDLNFDCLYNLFLSFFWTFYGHFFPFMFIFTISLHLITVGLLVIIDVYRILMTVVSILLHCISFIILVTYDVFRVLMLVNMLPWLSYMFAWYQGIVFSCGVVEQLFFHHKSRFQFFLMQPKWPGNLHCWTTW